MNPRKIFFLGIGFITLGCIALLYLGVRIENAYVKGVFAFNVTDSPNQKLKKLQCPLFMQINYTSFVTATILNPINATLNYSVSIEANDSIVIPGEHKLIITLSGDQATKVTWPITPTKGGYMAISVLAMSNNDRDLPGPFHLWPTSFRESCGILVLTGPLTGQQILFFGFTSILVGFGFSLYRPIRRRLFRHREKAI